MADDDSIMALLEEKHRREEEDLKIEIKALLKSAKKGKKAEIEAQAIQMEYDLRAKHMQEIEDFEENGVVDASLTSTVVEYTATATPVAGETTATPSMSKKEKSKRKKERKHAKEVAREVMKEQIKASSGPDNRAIETAKMNELLSLESLQVKQVEADGNCLYRALSDQINQALLLASTSVTLLNLPDPINYITLRSLAAQHIRNHPDHYAPFMGMESGTKEFEDYCRLVEDATGAEWGGHLEASALSACLEMPIWVYEVDKPIVKMGEEFESSVCRPLRVTYHRHYYSLGEHYNSVMDVTDSSSLTR